MRDHTEAVEINLRISGALNARIGAKARGKRRSLDQEILSTLRREYPEPKVDIDPLAAKRLLIEMNTALIRRQQDDGQWNDEEAFRSLRDRFAALIGSETGPEHLEGQTQLVTDVRPRARAFDKGPDGLSRVHVDERISAGENPVRVHREEQGMSLSDLAEASGLSAKQIGQIETGRLRSEVIQKKIADVLNVEVAELG